MPGTVLRRRLLGGGVLFSMAHDNVTTFEALLRQKGQVRALARTLVRDAAAADDLVQEALLGALRRPAAVYGDGRGLVARLLGNLARDTARGDARRARREFALARPEALPDVTQAVLAAERHRELAEAVLALAEPYRSVVLLRWFEDLPPRAIAARTGRNVAAVKKQLERGLALLRERLEARYGQGGAWAVAFLPLVGRDAVHGAWLTTASAKTLGSVLAGLLAVGAIAWAPWAPPAGAPDATVALAPDAAPTESSTTAEPDTRTSSRPAPAGASSSSTHDIGSPTAAARMTPPEPARFDPPFRAVLQGLAGEPLTRAQLSGLSLSFTFDAHGAAIGSSEVVHLTPDSTGAIGSDRVPANVNAGLGRLEVTSDGYVVLTASRPVDGLSTVVLAPAVDLGGIVTDARGEPIVGATVEVRADLRALESYPQDLVAGQRAWRVSTDELGRFELRRAPEHPRFGLEVAAKGFHPRSAPLPAHDDRALQIELEPDDAAHPMHVGVVVDGTGGPVAGVEVMLAWRKVATDDEGRFRIEAEEPSSRSDDDAPSPLVARAADGRFALLSVVDGGLGPHTLALPAEMRSISGRLLDERGRPMTGVKVALYDGTRTGSSSTLEARDGRGRAGQGTTDGEGRFELGQLLDREYTLRFLGQDPFLVLDVPGVPAGARQLEVRVPDGLRVPRVEGRAVDRFGRPLPGIEVGLTAFDSEPGAMRGLLSAPRVLTDEHGRFVLSDVPRLAARLAFDTRPDDGLGGVTLDVESLALDALGDVRLDLDCDVVARLAEGPIAARVRFVDDAGQRLTVREIVPHGVAFQVNVRQNGDGTFGRLFVPQTAATVEVLDDEGRLLRRVPLELAALGRNDLVW